MKPVKHLDRSLAHRLLPPWRKSFLCLLSPPPWLSAATVLMNWGNMCMCVWVCASVWVSMSMCECVWVTVCECVCEYEWLCMCIYRGQRTLSNVIPQGCPPTFLRPSLSWAWNSPSKLVSSRDPPISRCLHFRTGLARGHQIQFFNEKLSPPVCKAQTLPTELSPQPCLSY